MADTGGSGLGGYRSAGLIGRAGGPPPGSDEPCRACPPVSRWVATPAYGARPPEHCPHGGGHAGTGPHSRRAMAALGARRNAVPTAEWNTRARARDSSLARVIVVSRSTLASVRSEPRPEIEVFRCSAQRPLSRGALPSAPAPAGRVRELARRSFHGAVGRETFSTGIPVAWERNRRARSMMPAVGVVSISARRVRKRSRVREMASCRPRVCCRRMMSR